IDVLYKFRCRAAVLGKRIWCIVAIAVLATRKASCLYVGRTGAGKVTLIGRFTLSFGYFPLVLFLNALILGLYFLPFGRFLGGAVAVHYAASTHADCLPVISCFSCCHSCRSQPPRVRSAASRCWSSASLISSLTICLRSPRSAARSRVTVAVVKPAKPTG